MVVGRWEMCHDVCLDEELCGGVPADIGVLEIVILRRMSQSPCRVRFFFGGAHGAVAADGGVVGKIEAGGARQEFVAE